MYRSLVTVSVQGDGIVCPIRYPPRKTQAAPHAEARRAKGSRRARSEARAPFSCRRSIRGHAGLRGRARNGSQIGHSKVTG